MYPDRSALLCKQLGVKLHTLDPDNLPLLDVCTGQRVASEVDQDVAKYEIVDHYSSCRVIDS